MSNNVLGDSVLPVVLSNDLVAVAEANGQVLDITIDGIPFLMKPTQENPLLRQMVEDRKDQFDNSEEAGEQSFGYWWLRSQASFHGGAGQQFLDSGTASPQVSRTRFAESVGLYPFEPGELTVAAALDTTNPGGGVEWVRAVGVERSSVQYVAALRAGSDDIDLYRASDMDHSTLDLATTTAGVDMATDGSRLFVAVDDSIIRFDHSSSTPVEIATVTFDGAIRLGWAKDRLIFCMGQEVYEVNPNGSSVDLSIAGPHYTHPSDTWVWSDIADGPNGIYLSGYTGSLSTLSLMTETDSGGTLVLSPPVVQITMPTGERLNTVFFYVNSLFLLGTSEGCRVGQFTPYGQPQFGPLTVSGREVQEISAVASTAILGASTGLLWVDLGAPVDGAGRYAWAEWWERDADISEYVGLPVLVNGSSVAVYPVTVDLAYSQNTDPSEGTLTSSWYTFNTTEPKRVHYITVNGSFTNIPAAGSALEVTVENREGDTETHVVAGSATSTGLFEFGLSLPASGAYRFSVVLRDEGGVNILRSVQLKALPQSRRYRLFAIPLQCYNYEQPSGGESEIGYPGFAVDRILALESLAQQNATVTVQDNVFGVTYRAQLRDAQFRQDSGLEKGTERGPIGGHITAILSLVT